MNPTRQQILLALCALCGLCATPSAQPHSVLITEIMSDPAPAVGLPPHEWVELHNPGTAPVDLSGCRLADGNAAALIPPRTVLPPGGYLVLCAASSLPSMQAYGPALALPSFPSLGNEQDLILLRSAGGRTLHAVAYEAAWLGSKRDGGWSLELTTTTHPCAGRGAWAPSRAPAGGTPGAPNSTSGSVLPPPRLLRTGAPAPDRLRLYFSSGVDSLAATDPGLYRVPGYGLRQVLPLAPLFMSVDLVLDRPIEKRIVMTVSSEGVPDCAGGRGSGSAPAGWPEPPAPGDLVINEILFQPRAGGHEYIEIFHRGRAPADVATLFLSVALPGEGPPNGVRLQAGARALYPGEYLLLTPDTALLRSYYRGAPEDALLTVPLPALPESARLLLHAGETLLDEVAYSSAWHYPVLTDAAGTSLERVRAEGPSSAAGNWHSAATTSGGGTPGYRNSQDHPTDSTGSAGLRFTVQPEVFRPGNDGAEDLAAFILEGGEGGGYLQLTVFSSEGRPVCTVEGGAITGRKNVWHWNGTGTGGRTLPAGIYVVHAEAVWMNGKRRAFKRAVTLLR